MSIVERSIVQCARGLRFVLVFLSLPPLSRVLNNNIIQDVRAVLLLFEDHLVDVDDAQCYHRFQAISSDGMMAITRSLLKHVFELFAFAVFIALARHNFCVTHISSLQHIFAFNMTTHSRRRAMR